MIEHLLGWFDSIHGFLFILKQEVNDCMDSNYDSICDQEK